MASVKDGQSTAIAEVVTASTLSDEARARLIEKLSTQVGSTVTLNERVVPSVIGGIRVQLGDYLYDSTIAGQLRDVRSALLDVKAGG